MSFCRVSPQGAGPPPALYKGLCTRARGQHKAKRCPPAAFGALRRGGRIQPPGGGRGAGLPPPALPQSHAAPHPVSAGASSAPGNGVQRGRREPRGENIVKNKTKTNRRVPRRQRPPRCPSCCHACSATSCQLPSPAMAPRESPGEEEAAAGGPSPCSPSGAHLGPRFVLCLISFSVLAAPTSWPINIYIYLYPK